jgi:hypothetical protein
VSGIRITVWMVLWLKGSVCTTRAGRL